MKTDRNDPARRQAAAPAANQPIYRKSPPFLAPAESGRLASSMAIRYGRHLRRGAG